jgi:DNA repair exonuclease SbcCD ATPase subunit
MGSEGYNKFTTKKIVLTKKLEDVTYELMTKTISDMVYVDQKTTLTEKLAEMTDLLVDNSKNYNEFKYALEGLVKDSKDQAEKLQDVWNYVNLSGDPKSALIQLIDNKVDKVEGKGLSANDFTDIMKAKLENDYSKEELDEKFSSINDQVNKLEEELLAVKKSQEEITSKVEELAKKPNVVVEKEDSNVKNDDVWFDIVS